MGLPDRGAETVVPDPLLVALEVNLINYNNTPITSYQS